MPTPGFDTGKWNTNDDYPFTNVCATMVVDFAMLYIPETLSYLLIGGSDDSGTSFVYISQIAKF